MFDFSSDRVFKVLPWRARSSRTLYSERIFPHISIFPLICLSHRRRWILCGSLLYMIHCFFHARNETVPCFPMENVSRTPDSKTGGWSVSLKDSSNWYGFNDNWWDCRWGRCSWLSLIERTVTLFAISDSWILFLSQIKLNVHSDRWRLASFKQGFRELSLFVFSHSRIIEMIDTVCAY